MLKKVTLRFPSLQLLADCMFQLGVNNPEIDYEKYIVVADLTDKQLEEAAGCQAEIIDQIVLR
jgi:hypothetical protein